MTETVDPPTKLKLRPAMGLQYVKPDKLPIHVRAGTGTCGGSR